jgi:AMIN domain
MIRRTTVRVRLARRAAAAASAVLLVSASSPVPAFADWLVTRDGQLIETQGPWRIEGGQVVFASRAIPVTGWISRSGSQFTVGVDQVDLARSASETKVRSGVLREVPAVAALRAPAAPRTMLEGWEDGGYRGRPPDRVEVTLKLGGAAWDNFLQESDPHQEVAAGIAEGRLAWRAFAGVKSYVEVGHIRYDYDDVPSTVAYEAGFRWDSARHGFQAAGRLEPGRRAPELDDAAEVADIRKYKARYFGHSRAFEWSMGGERVEQRFDGGPARESTGHRARAALLYRGFGERIAPEVAFGWGLRDATGEAEDERQRTLQLGIRSRPVSPLSVAVRFESTRRRFVVADVRARNFGREDTRRRWILEGEIDLTRQLAFSVQYSLVEGVSTRADRDFTEQNASAGLTVTLGSTRAAARSPRRQRPAQPVPARRTEVPQPATEQGPLLFAAPDAASEGPASGWTRIGNASNDGPRPGLLATPPPPERPRAAAPAVPAASSLLDLRTKSVGGETTITLHGDGELRYSTVTLATPHRFVVDLLGVLVGSSRTIAVGGDLVRRLRVAQFRPGPSPVGRIVFDLEIPARVEVERREGALQIRLRRPDGWVNGE